MRMGGRGSTWEPVTECPIRNGSEPLGFLLLGFLQRRKLDAVYYYMRSLAASNPILTAKESLMSLFEETKRKVSLGAGLWDAAPACAGEHGENGSFWTFGDIPYLLLRNFMRETAFRKKILGWFGQLNLLFLGHKLI